MTAVHLQQLLFKTIDSFFLSTEEEIFPTENNHYDNDDPEIV